MGGRPSLRAGCRSKRLRLCNHRILPPTEPLPNASLPDPPVSSARPAASLRIDNSACSASASAALHRFSCQRRYASKYLADDRARAPHQSGCATSPSLSIMLSSSPHGGFRLMRTRRPGLHLLRALGVTIPRSCSWLGLQFLPMADATATSFVAPLFVTALSIPAPGRNGRLAGAGSPRPSADRRDRRGEAGRGEGFHRASFFRSRSSFAGRSR